MFKKVLIANRGAIACRVIRTLKRMGIASVAVYSRADQSSLHVLLADEAVCIGEDAPVDSYLSMDKVLEVAKKTSSEAIHPGYGFLSESSVFAQRCSEMGICFIGPAPEHLESFGLKHTARRLAEQNGVPLLPGTGLLSSVYEATKQASIIGYPVMLKSTAGGGGIGMQLCRSGEELNKAYDAVARLAQNNFADAGIFLEKYVEHARHIEVQIFGDGLGKVIALGERDCSLQRRNQKVVEESPAPHLSEHIRQQLFTAAEQLGQAVNYSNVGTVEFIFDAASQAFYFLEVNTRLQVEHGVTEEVTGIDLVEWMLKQAAGEMGELETMRPTFKGHAIQVRLYAEDPAKQFQPSTGLITHAHFCDAIRVDTWVEPGVEVTPFYDPMLAKLIAWGSDRNHAMAKLSEALLESDIAGLETNRRYVLQLLQDRGFQRAEVTTRYLNDFHYTVPSIDVLTSGTQTTVQDYPGRQGYWDIGIPPSGPMDDYAFRLGNRLLKNSELAAGLEMTITGPVLRFNSTTYIVLTGAAMKAELDGQPVAFWQVQKVTSGSVLKLGRIEGGGARSYLCVYGGLDVPEYMGSRSTFTLGQFGGHGGRTLQVGDVLHLNMSEIQSAESSPTLLAIPETMQPVYQKHWQIKVMYGPHGAPDFFTDQDMTTFFATQWEVHYNSSRTGVRLLGPKPKWARPDGGEAGLHPSNLHDNAYAIGAVDFTGDMPVILGPDGPSLGGFVCPATIISAERWKMGQLRPGDSVSFIPVSQEDANQLELAQIASIESLSIITPEIHARALSSPIVRSLTTSEHPVGVTYRPSGDKYLLIEYGPMVLDIKLRFRVHALMLKLQEMRITGLRELTPGIRSLQVHYNSLTLSLEKLLDTLVALESELGDVESLSVAARVVYLPLAWDDSQTRLATEKYMQSVRTDAPWCPSNIEFIRRINGLKSIDEVKEIVYKASYLVMGLGDVYLGAPVATPMDPRHRLVTTKYNPARTWTPENAVGIGGAYLCVYGMEGPGGYQFVGRTVQMWNRWKQTKDFTQPWLLRFFDQIRFYPVSEQDLMQIRQDFPRGKYSVKTESTEFKLKDYLTFLEDNKQDIDLFKAKQQQAFAEERERWQAMGVAEIIEEQPLDEHPEDELELGAHQSVVESHVHGSVWKINIAEGDRVAAGQELMVLESMKMEIAIYAEGSGVVSHLLCQAGNQVKPGQRLLIIDISE